MGYGGLNARLVHYFNVGNASHGTLRSAMQPSSGNIHVVVGLCNLFLGEFHLPYWPDPGRAAPLRGGTT